MRDEAALTRDAFAGEYDPRHPIEEQVRQLWRELVHGRGGYSWHIGDSRGSDPGWPDESTLVRGRLLFVEFKSPGGKPTDEQQLTLELLNNAGAEAYLVTSTGDRNRDLLALTRLLESPMPRGASR